MAIQLRDIIIAPTLQNDVQKITDLHATLFGPGRFARTAYRVREDGPLISPFCQTAKWNECIVAAITFTEICIGGKPGALLLGPLAVSASYANLGIGRALIRTSLTLAKSAKIQLAVLVGDLSYYSRAGFVAVAAEQILLPGPVDPGRILACEFRQDALRDYQGIIRAA